MGEIAKTRLRLENEAKSGLAKDTLPELSVLLQQLQKPFSEEVKPDTILEKVDTGKIDLDNYEFQSDYKQLNEPVVKSNDIQPKVLIEDTDGQIKVKTKKSKSRRIQPRN